MTDTFGLNLWSINKWQINQFELKWLTVSIGRMLSLLKVKPNCAVLNIHNNTVSCSLLITILSIKTNPLFGPWRTSFCTDAGYWYRFLSSRHFNSPHVSFDICRCREVDWVWWVAYVLSSDQTNLDCTNQ